jgi:hypothetical protein
MQGAEQMKGGGDREEVHGGKREGVYFSELR